MALEPPSTRPWGYGIDLPLKPSYDAGHVSQSLPPVKSEQATESIT